MIPPDVKAPAVPIPFQHLLKVVALVDERIRTQGCFPGFSYEVQGVYRERMDGQIKFHTYVVRE
jgi:hypothetical protein